MTLPELKVTLAVMRLTLGYQRTEHAIDSGTLEHMTGLSPSLVTLGIRCALDRGVICIAQQSDPPVYAVNTAPTQGNPIDYAEYLQSPHWQVVRNGALKRAGYRCMACNSAEQLEVHHRTYANLGREAEQDVIALCAVCHGKIHAEEE
jgi:hypothetical protein